MGIVVGDSFLLATKDQRHTEHSVRIVRMGQMLIGIAPANMLQQRSWIGWFCDISTSSWQKVEYDTSRTPHRFLDQSPHEQALHLFSDSLSLTKGNLLRFKGKHRQVLAVNDLVRVWISVDGGLSFTLNDEDLTGDGESCAVVKGLDVSKNGLYRLVVLFYDINGAVEVMN